MIVWKVLIFLLTSAALVYVSWRALRKPRSHGFTRFFAWEAILVLALLNMDWWFTDPISLNQVLSWLLLATSLYLVVEGLIRLRSARRSVDTRQDTALLGMEQTVELVEDGVYKVIRHPLYSSLMCLAWGIFLKRPGWSGVLLASTASFCLYLTARREEVENLDAFGTAYAGYMQRTKRFVPYIW